MVTRFTKLLRAAALAGATVGLTACVAEPYGYSAGYGAPSYGYGGGYGGGYYAGGYRPAPVFAQSGFRPQPHFAPAFQSAPVNYGRPGGGFFGGGGGFAPRPVAPARTGGFFPAPRGPSLQHGGGGFFGRPHHR